MLRLLVLAVRAWFRSKAAPMAENLCLRQQLVVLKRRQPRPKLRDADRRFWIGACRWLPRWQDALIVVQRQTVLRWHRQGWKAYWRWRSRRWRGRGRPRIPREVRALIRRITSENSLWGQRRIQAELARLGFRVCARAVAKYMRRPLDGQPSPGWRRCLAQHAQQNLGLRSVHRSDYLVPDAVCLLRYRSWHARNHPRPSNGPSDGAVARSADGGGVRL